MIRRNRIMAIVIGLLILAALDILLMASGYRVLVGEEMVEEYILAVTPHGRAIKTGETLQCDYFTGRSVQRAPAHRFTEVPDECPLLVKTH